MTDALLLSERLRPKAFSELTLPMPDVNRLEQMLASGAIMNMLFYGNTGTGKTSAARIFGQALGRWHFQEFDGTALGLGSVRQKRGVYELSVEGYASSRSLYRGIRLCFIDAADYMSNPAQAALHKIIEDHHGTTRFVLAVNDPHKLIDPIKSRLLAISFDIEATYISDLQRRLIARCERELTDAGIEYNPSRLRHIVETRYPDLRAITTRLQYEFAV